MAAEPSAGDPGPPAGDRTLPDISNRCDGTPVLFDGSEGGRLLPQLLDRLSDRALDRIDMAVSFVMKSGLARIVGPLEDALDRGAHVRILTTNYLAITDPDALTQLADLASGPDRRLHRLVTNVRRLAPSRVRIPNCRWRAVRGRRGLVPVLRGP